MSKVITLTGLHQASSLKGWDECKSVEAKDSAGKPVVRCAGTKAITLSGTGSSRGKHCKRVKMKNGKTRCRCGNRFVKSSRCSKSSRGRTPRGNN